jgi:hypothetical protein
VTFGFVAPVAIPLEPGSVPIRRSERESIGSDLIPVRSSPVASVPTSLPQAGVGKGPSNVAVARVTEVPRMRPEFSGL